MATIITKNSSTASSVPLAAQLVQGELAVNVTDKRLFTENSGGTVVELGTNPSSITNAGNLAFTGTGNRITGDFSNATVANRVAFQTSTVNGPTQVSALPNGTGQNGGFTGYGGSDPANASFVRLSTVSATESRLESGITGTGTFLPMTFSTGGSERVRVDTSGNVGIGTSAPITASARLSVKASGDYDAGLAIGSNASANNWARLDFKNTNAGTPGVIYQDQAGSFVLRTDGAYPIAFHTNGGNERMRIDSSGNLGIGTSSPFAKLNPAGATSTSTTAYDSTSPPAAGQLDVRSTDAYTTQRGGKVTFSGIAGTGAVALSVYGAIQGYKANATISNAGGGLIFSSTANATGLLTEAARIDDSGNLLVGCTSLPSASVKGSAFLNDAGQGRIYVAANSTVARDVAYWINPNGVVGTVTTSGTSTAYNTSSDYRLKEAVIPMAGALAKVALLKPCTYKWKVDGSDGQGFIAHELAEVEAGCVTGEKDAVDADGNPQYQGIDTSFLVATLAAAIQELKAIVDAQGAEIAALKSI